MNTKTKWALGAAGVVAAAVAIYMAAPKAVTPVPGYWHQGSVLVPCSVVKAYETWVSPADEKVYALRYDYTAVFQQLGGTLPRDGAQGAGNHTKQAWLLDGFLHPFEPQPDVDNYYPAPIAAWGCVLDIHGTTWNAYNTSPCPISSLAAYQSKIAQTSVWTAGQQFYAAQRQSECSAPAPTKTPTPPRTPTVPSGGMICWTVTPQMVCVTPTPRS